MLGRGAQPPGELGAGGDAELGVYPGQLHLAGADQLYLSVGTVEVQLSRVYAKLGITSRAQLARRLGAPA